MAKTPKKPRKLTKAEAGRIGGKATLAKHGTEHFRTIGKAGFAALRRKFGFMGGSGRGALRWLNKQGRIPAAPDPDPESRIFHELWEQLAPPDEEDPVIAQILASIRSAPIPADGGL
jgi:hypothetical protein